MKSFLVIFCSLSGLSSVSYAGAYNQPMTTKEAIQQICKISKTHCALLKTLEHKLSANAEMIDPTLPKIWIKGLEGSDLEGIRINANFDPYGVYHLDFHARD